MENIKVLIVESDKNILMIFSEAIKKKGCNIFVARRGNQVWKILRDNEDKIKLIVIGQAGRKDIGILVRKIHNSGFTGKIIVSVIDTTLHESILKAGATYVVQLKNEALEMAEKVISELKSSELSA